MSYCRFGEADVYVYHDVGGYINCCACPRGEQVPTIIEGLTMGRDFKAYTRSAMIEHLEWHRELGDDVPEDVFERLRREIAEGNDAVAPSS